MAKFPSMTIIDDENDIGNDIKGCLVKACHTFIQKNVENAAQFFYCLISVLREMDAEPEKRKLLDANWVCIPETIEVCRIRSPGTLFMHGGFAASKKGAYR